MRSHQTMTFAFLLMIALAGGLVRAAEPTHVRDVVYGRTAGLALTMNVLKPETPSGVGVLFMVSGGFSSDMGIVGKEFFPLALFQPFLDRGQTVFLVGHGSQPKFTVAEILPFIRRAVRFIRTNAADYGVDPNRLGIMGMSSGGYLSLMMGTTPAAGDPDADDPVDRASSEVEAVACLCPPADLVDFGDAHESFLEFKPVEFVWHTIPVKDKPHDEQVKTLTELSPIAQVTPDDAPTLIIHGDRDELVPYHQTQRFVEKLKGAGVEAKLIVREGAGHSWPEIPTDMGIMADWFDEHLKAAKP